MPWDCVRLTAGRGVDRFWPHHLHTTLVAFECGQLQREHTQTVSEDRGSGQVPRLAPRLPVSCWTSAEEAFEFFNKEFNFFSSPANRRSCWTARLLGAEYQSDKGAYLLEPHVIAELP